MATPIVVGMGEIGIGTKPDDVLIAVGLGSCIGLCMFDPTTRICAMAHVVLPESTGFTSDALGKFGDTAVPFTLDAMKSKGANSQSVFAAVVGGAQLFSFGSAANNLDIGLRNAIRIEQELAKLRIPIVARDTGGTSGRTVHVYVESGLLNVKTIGRGEVALGEMYQMSLPKTN